MELRSNFDINPLAARRLKKNYAGLSKKGEKITTDHFGFRCLPKPDQRTDDASIKKNLILAGDSIAFGMYLPFKKSWGYHLQHQLINWNVLVQALPGGSQALTLQHLFGDDHLAKQTQAKWIIHSLTHYDNTDNWLYEEDMKKQAQETTIFFRLIQKYCGPYWIQMIKLKVRSFFQKDQRKQLLFANSVDRKGATERALTQLKARCLKDGISLAIVFTPDRGELLAKGDPGLQARELCNHLNLPFFDLNRAFRNEHKKENLDLKLIFRKDNIHFTPLGAKWAGKLLSQWFKETAL